MSFDSCWKQSCTSSRDPSGYAIYFSLGLSSLRILLIGNYPLDQQQSMLRFADLLERELKDLGHTVRLLRPQPILAGQDSGSSGLGKWIGYVDKFLLFPRKLKSVKNSFDVAHICDHSNSMYTRYLRDVPHVVTCHDMLAVRSALGEVPENPVSRTGREFQRMIVAGLKRAQRVICDSENTRMEVLRVTGRTQASVSRVYLGLNYPYSPMDPGEAAARLKSFPFDATFPFFIHVGGGQWYKNRLGLLRIFDHLHHMAPARRFHLLMVGPSPSASMRDFLRESGLNDLVHRVSGVSNEDLRAAYSLAQGLIFPSLQEGFGWPILEAQACGCPVFTNRRAPMTELGGDAAVYFDTSAEAAAAGIIKESMANRSYLQRKGLENVKRFQEAIMMREYVNIYEEVASEKSIGHRRSVDPPLT
jgi:glycosyltransferase involved in cell wall biosynthesis